MAEQLDDGMLERMMDVMMDIIDDGDDAVPIMVVEFGPEYEVMIAGFHISEESWPERYSMLEQACRELAEQTGYPHRLMWIADSWELSVTPEQLDSGQYLRPRDAPNRREVVIGDESIGPGIVTRARAVPYRRTSDGIEWAEAEVREPFQSNLLDACWEGFSPI